MGAVKRRVRRWAMAAAAAAAAACAGVLPAPAPEPDPADIVRLTFDGVPKGQPALAPDGRRIAYVADRGDGWQIRVLDPAMRDDRARTAVDGPVGGPVWAADGAAIHFYAAAEGSWRRFVVPAAGAVAGHELQPRPDGGLLAAFRPRPEPGGPRVLLDGVRIEGEDHDLFLFDPAAGSLRRVAPDEAYDSDARWSPDGGSVVFHSDRGRERYALRVYRVDLADGRILPLTPDDDAVYAYPAWSPSGHCVAHTVERDGDRDLRVSDAEGRWGAVVDPRPGFDGDPVFTADGRALIAATDRWGGLELARIPLPVELAARCATAGADAPPRDLHTSGPS